MQGEGQEFESPRLHHPARAPHHRPSLPCPVRSERVHRPADRWPRRRFAGIALDPPSRAGRTFTTGIGSAEREVVDLRFRRVVKEPSGPRPAADRWVRCWWGSSYTGHEVDALAPRADEGRGRLRKASGSREQTLIRGCPNGETPPEKSGAPWLNS